MLFREREGEGGRGREGGRCVRLARCEVTCFDVNYGNLSQIHSVQAGTRITN